MINLGEAARFLRERLGLSQRAAAAELGISHVQLNNIENGKASPRADTIEKYYEAWGIDLYMLAVAKFSDEKRIPRKLQNSVRDLRRAWNDEIETLISRRQKDGFFACSESRN